MATDRQRCPGISRRDVGAGAVAGVTALLANVLFHASLAARMVISNPATVFADPDIVWSTFQWGPLTALPLVVAPVAALVVGTAVWRTMLPDDPTPRRGAWAGVATAVGSLLGVALASAPLLDWPRCPRAHPSRQSAAFSPSPPSS